MFTVKLLVEAGSQLSNTSQGSKLAVLIQAMRQIEAGCHLMTLL